MATSKRHNEKSAKDDIINRAYVLYALFIIIGVVIAGLLIWTLVGNKNVEKHIELMNENIIDVETTEAHRGAILTRDGEPLAMSSRRYEPLLDFAAEGMDSTRYKKGSEKVQDELMMLAKQMSLFFNKSDAEQHGYKYRTAKEYYDLFTKQLSAKEGNREVKIFPRAVVLDDWNMMRKEFPVINYSLGGVYKEVNNYVRIYPYDDLARQLVGICRGRRDLVTEKKIVTDTAGRKVEKTIKRDTIIRVTSALENIYDSLLAGRNGSYVQQRIANGFWVRIDDPRNSEPIDGHNVVTTIDGDLQRLATESLRKQLEEHCGSFGVAMVMETATGNMLCMVNLSTGKVRGTDYSESVYNHAMKTRLAPGSTFKFASTMALLEIGGATLNTRVDVPDRTAKVGERTIRDEHTMRDEDHKQITQPTLLEGFAHSSNIYYSKAVYERFGNDPSKYTTYLDGLLFNSHIGLREYGARKGIVHHPDSRVWKSNGGPKWVFPQMPYGYYVELVPIHTLTFYNGVANGGKMVAPRFVDRIEFGGNVVETKPTEVLLERMCSAQTQRDLIECLKAGAAPARTKRKFVDLPVNLGCKTGTAQIWGKFETISPTDTLSFSKGFIDEDGNVKFYLGSLIAVMPIEQPRYTIMVAMGKEKTATHKTYYGADVAGDVVRDIADYLYNNDLSLHPSVESSGTQHRPTAIKRGRSTSVSQVAQSLCDAGAGNDFGSEWSRATIDNGEVHIEPMNVASGQVPNVVGMGLMDAIYILEQQGISVTHSGAGRVIEQSLAPGTKISNKRRKINLTLGM